MTPDRAFRVLLLALADVYAAEDREGARLYVRALRDGADTAKPETGPPDRLDPVILAATEGAAHPAAKAARAAHSLLHWRPTGILDEHIPKSVSDAFAVALLVGPGAPVESTVCSGGLFVQRSGALYPPHAHAAEETYAMLAGKADWQKDLGAWNRHGPGALIHHPSQTPHATRTGTLPILAAWRWSGDLRVETYRMVTEEAHDA